MEITIDIWGGQQLGIVQEKPGAFTLSRVQTSIVQDSYQDKTDIKVKSARDKQTKLRTLKEIIVNLNERVNQFH